MHSDLSTIRSSGAKQVGHDQAGYAILQGDLSHRNERPGAIKQRSWALPVPGGMMRLGIPAYRLPQDVLQHEIDAILGLPGVELHLNYPIQNINNLFDRGFEAIVLAVGAHAPQKTEIPGKDASAPSVICVWMPANLALWITIWLSLCRN